MPAVGPKLPASLMEKSALKLIQVTGAGVDRLDEAALKQLGIPGQTMGDRLKSGRSHFANYETYNSVWRAHKLRNSLAHDVGFDLVVSQANDALHDFEKGLKELGAL